MLPVLKLYSSAEMLMRNSLPHLASDFPLMSMEKADLLLCSFDVQGSALSIAVNGTVHTYKNIRLHVKVLVSGGLCFS